MKPRTGYTQVPEARVKAALKRHAGNISLAARACGISRQALWSRVQRSPELQAFIYDVEEDTCDMVENAIIEAVRNGDMATARWWADRRMRHRGYGPRIDTLEVTPPDPDAEAKRMKAVAFFSRVIEERARLGLPSIFDDAGAITRGAVFDVPPSHSSTIGKSSKT
jgi:Bacterial regulatory protein, Fis family